MRIGFDVDGVLANFIPAYQALAVSVAGEDKFLPGDNVDPPCWDWPEYRGYSKEVIREVWSHIKRSETFWLNLGTMPDVKTLALLISSLERNHEVYYVTSRVGNGVKRQSELWLWQHLDYNSIMGAAASPTVLISSAKGAICKALKLDMYVDDNFDNVQNCAEESPLTRTYLLNRRYNNPLTAEGMKFPGPLSELVIRVGGLGEVFDAEINNL